MTELLISLDLMMMLMMMMMILVCSIFWIKSGGRQIHGTRDAAALGCPGACGRCRCLWRSRQHFWRDESLDDHIRWDSFLGKSQWQWQILLLIDEHLKITGTSILFWFHDKWEYADFLRVGPRLKRGNSTYLLWEHRIHKARLGSSCNLIK